MRLNEIRDRPGSTHRRMRVGRGIGSGKGKTCGRGHKGQKARKGVAVAAFEGGQMPIYRRLPKRGFHNLFRTDFVPVNFDRLQQAIDAKRLDPGKPVDDAALYAAGLVRRSGARVRLLARGELKVALTMRVAGASKAAIAALEKLGGKVEITAPSPDIKEKGSAT